MNDRILMRLNEISRLAHKRGDNKDRKAGRIVREIDELREELARS